MWRARASHVSARRASAFFGDLFPFIQAPVVDHRERPRPRTRARVDAASRIPRATRARARARHFARRTARRPAATARRSERVAGRVASRPDVPRSFAERGSEHPRRPGGWQRHVGLPAARLRRRRRSGSYIVHPLPRPDVLSRFILAETRRPTARRFAKARSTRRDLTRRIGRDRSRSPRTTTSERPPLTSPLTLFSFPLPSFFPPPDES